MQNSNVAPLTGDISEAVSFITDFRPRGLLNLVALDPEKQSPPVGITRDVTTCMPDLEAFIKKHNGRRNVYFTVNIPKIDAPDAKLSKADIAGIVAIYADIDPDQTSEAVNGLDAERQRLHALGKALLDHPAYPATYVIDSGNGIQPIWMLANPEPADAATIDLVEGHGLGLAEKHHSDHVQNVDRIFRLPGTINLPDAKKRAKGRSISRAKVLGYSGETIVIPDLSHVAPYVPAKQAAQPSPRLQEELDWDAATSYASRADLPRALQDKLAVCRATDKTFDARYAGSDEGLNDTSRSGYLASMVTLLKKHNFTPTDACAVVWTWDYSYGPDLSLRDFGRAWVNSPIHTAAEVFGAVDDEVMAACPDSSVDPARFQFISFAQAAEDALTIYDDPLVDGFLDQGAMSVLYGASNAGKTFVAVSLAFDIATGAIWGGCACTRKAVAYVIGEGARGFRRRIAALALKKGHTDNFHILLQSVNLLDPKADLKDLIAALLALPDLGFVVIDTLSRALHGGDENSSVDMGALVANVDAIRAATGVHIMLVHHTGKDEARGARGHSLLRAATDTEIEVTRSADGEALGGTIEVKKQRDLDGNWRRNFTMESVTLGEVGGKFITSLVCEVEVVQAEKRKQPEKMYPGDQAILDIIVQNGGPIASADLLCAAIQETGREYTRKTLSTVLTRLKTSLKISNVPRGFWSPVFSSLQKSSEIETPMKPPF